MAPCFGFLVFFHRTADAIVLLIIQLRHTEAIIFQTAMTWHIFHHTFPHPIPPALSCSSLSPSQLAVTHPAPPGAHNRRRVCEEGQQFMLQLSPSSRSAQWGAFGLIYWCRLEQVQTQCIAGTNPRRREQWDTQRDRMREEEGMIEMCLVKHSLIRHS